MSTQSVKVVLDRTIGRTVGRARTSAGTGKTLRLPVDSHVISFIHAYTFIGTCTLAGGCDGRLNTRRDGAMETGTWLG